MIGVDRPILERNRAEIERKLSTMGDYVKMSYLQRALKSGLDFDTRKFVFIKLAEIYEQRKMYLEASKMIKSAAEINTTFKDKIKDFMKAVELTIKAGDFVESDRLFAQALALGNDGEKQLMKSSRKNYYLNQAKSLLTSDKRSLAKQVYEKALTLELDSNERKEVQQKLMDLYNKLGLVREYYKIKDGRVN